MNEERIMEAFSNEEVAEEMKRKDEVLKRIEQNINPECESDHDKYMALCKGNNFYGLFSDLFESIGAQKSYLKVPFKFEILDVLEAMMMAYGIIDEEKVKEYHRSENLIGMDGEWISEMADQIKKHWEDTRDFHENVRKNAIKNAKQ